MLRAFKTPHLISKYLFEIPLNGAPDARNINFVKTISNLFWHK
jgi:hypothetical protein